MMKELSKEHAEIIIEAHCIDEAMACEGEDIFYNNFELYEAYKALCEIAGVNYWKPE
jgi:hypothetical protein